MTNIKIMITADSVDEARAAFAQLAGERPAAHITVVPAETKIEGGELTIPAGTKVTVADVEPVDIVEAPEPEPAAKPTPEKPKTRKKAAKQQEPAEKPQIAPSEPVAPAAPAAPATPQAAAVEPAEASVPTLDQIAAAGARLLDADPNAMQPLLDLLRDFNVQAITQLKDDQLAGFAEKLRGLGAEV